MSRPACPAAMVLAAVLLAGCGSLTPAAGTPAAELRSNWRAGPDDAVPALEPALADAASRHAWAVFFTDARLRQTVGLALDGNRSLRATSRIVEAARLPEVRATAAATLQSGTGAAADSTRVSLGFSA